MTISQACRSSALKKDRVLTGRGLQSQLIQGQDLTAGLQNALAGLLGDVQGSDRHFRDLEEPQVIGNSTDDDCGLAITTSLLHVTSQSGDRDWGSVHLGHEETAKHNFVELGIGTTSQEAVQLDEESQVDILGLWCSPTDLSVLLVADIDSLEERWRAVENFAHIAMCLQCLIAEKFNDLTKNSKKDDFVLP